MSQTATYYLQQLAALVKRKTKIRHKLSDKKSIINLLRYSCTSADMRIYDAYSDFIYQLDDDQLEHLESHGLLMPVMNFTQTNNCENFKLRFQSI